LSLSGSKCHTIGPATGKARTSSSSSVDIGLNKAYSKFYVVYGPVTPGGRMQNARDAQ